MATVESISELKQLIIGIDGKVGILSNKLDNIEDRFTRIVTEIKSEVDEVKTDVTNTKLEVQKLREDHLELEKGVGHIELEINRVLLEKHERKYNALVYGVPESDNEDIHAVLNTFFIQDLKIDKEKAESFPIANAHRIPSRQTSDQIRRPAHIIVRFIHHGDKQYALSKGYNLSNKHMRIVDDLPPVMKESRHELAKLAYKIRNEEHLQTRIKVVGTRILLQTRTNSKDNWFLRREALCCLPYK
ncbi:unnamed protein product [Mytilus edulis]|uniref:L1 transposable element RRM domain-containing protein n=1 Tax=Mytilus edulis TaxID=6550 RepID=A0A8S3VDR7_MYTED|nr:unnamed protein product [Mytilus edulis]